MRVRGSECGGKPATQNTDQVSRAGVIAQLSAVVRFIHRPLSLLMFTVELALLEQGA